MVDLEDRADRGDGRCGGDDGVTGAAGFHQEGGAGTGEDADQLGRSEPLVQEHQDPARPGYGVVALDPGERVLADDGDPIARVGQGLHDCGDLCHPFGQGAEGERRATEGQRRRGRALAGSVRDEIVEEHGRSDRLSSGRRSPSFIVDVEGSRACMSVATPVDARPVGGRAIQAAGPSRSDQGLVFFGPFHIASKVGG